MQGYRTVLIASLIAVFGALQGLDWVSLIPDANVAGWIVSGIGLVMFVLRWFTTTPIGDRE